MQTTQHPLVCSPGYAETFATAAMDTRAQQQYADSFATAPLDAGTAGPGAYAESFMTAPPTGTDSATEARAVSATLTPALLLPCSGSPAPSLEVRPKHRPNSLQQHDTERGQNCV